MKIDMRLLHQRRISTIFVILAISAYRHIAAFSFQVRYQTAQHKHKYKQSFGFSNPQDKQNLFVHHYQTIQYVKPISRNPRSFQFDRILHILSLSSDTDTRPDTETNKKAETNQKSKRSRRQSVLNIARNIVEKPQAIKNLLKDAAVELSSFTSSNTEDITQLRQKTLKAFETANKAIDEAQHSLNVVRDSLNEAKMEAIAAIEEAEASQLSLDTLEFKNIGMNQTSSLALEPKTDDNEIFPDIEALSYDDVDYEMSEMAPPFIGEDMCLVPGVPLVRVEKAPDNSRRIFAGIDIMAGVDDVWDLLTDYAHLQEVVPNLAVNEVLELYEGDPETHTVDFQEDPNIPSEIQCENIANKLKGAKLKQVGKAKVVGINFSARTTLEVREWPEGMPDFAHFNDDLYHGESREKRVQDYKVSPLQRYCFPRPFAISKLPTKDISMQSIVDDDGEFRIYQGVWRMQPLPGCSAPGSSAMRLTYAVEISPRAYLPVRLVEGRIAQDLCANLESIRDFVQR